MSLLSSVTDKNGNKLSEKKSERKKPEPTEPSEKVRKFLNEQIEPQIKKHGKKVSLTLTQLKKKSTKLVENEFSIISEPFKSCSKVGHNVVGVPFYKVYAFKIFVEETNICESYTDEKGVEHFAKDEIKESKK